ncbi:MAG: PQQ-binding-like beta-propeller repeat protein [Pirellulales bacterium]|nr:PQQ-binding-like beta-propeller repeat protein [Pirellulales bacterium]
MWKTTLAMFIVLLASDREMLADPPTLPTAPLRIARDSPQALDVDPNTLTRPTRLYTVCALGGMAEHGFIKDGRVYAPGGGGVACWDLRTGEVLRRYSHVGGTTMPILEHGVLVGVGGGGVRAVSASDGKVLWHAAAGPVGAEALVYYDDGQDRFVIVQGQTGLSKLRFDDGEIVATHPIGSCCVPALDKKNRWIYAQENQRLVKLSAEDLRPIWDVGLVGGASSASPILIDDEHVGYRVFANTGDGNVYCVTADGRIAWQHSFGGTMNGLMTYHQGMLIEHGYPSIVRAVDGRDGKVIWVFDAKDLHDSQETFWTAPLLIGDRLLVPTADGPGRAYLRQKFFVLDPATGRKLQEFEFDAPGSSCGVPMASAGTVIFHDNMHSRWTAVKVGQGEPTDWYPFRGDEAHTGAPAHQEKIVTAWYEEAQEKAAWRQASDWLFLDRFERPAAPGLGNADFPPLGWKSEGPPGSTTIGGGELVVTGAGATPVGVYHEYAAAPRFTVEGTVTFGQTDAPNQWFALISYGWQQRLGLMAHADGFIYLMGSSRQQGTAASDLWTRSDLRYEANKAYAFRIQIDCDRKWGEYSIDGKPLGKGHFAKYGSPCCLIAATQDSRGSFRLGEIAVYQGQSRTTNP